MSDNSFHGVFWVKNVPKIHTEDGFFHICYDSGNAHFEFVIRPSIWQRTRREADRADKQFREAKANVTPIRRKRAKAEH